MSVRRLLIAGQWTGAALLGLLPMLGIVVLAASSALRRHISVMVGWPWGWAWTTIFTLSGGWIVVNRLVNGTWDASVIAMLAPAAVATALRWHLPQTTVLAAAGGLALVAVFATLEFAAMQRNWRPMNAGEALAVSLHEGSFVLRDTRAGLMHTWRTDAGDDLTLRFSAWSLEHAGAAVRVTPWYPGISSDATQSLRQTLTLTSEPQVFELRFSEIPYLASGSSLSFIVEAVDSGVLPLRLRSTQPTLSDERGPLPSQLVRYARATIGFSHPNLAAHTAFAVALAVASRGAALPTTLAVAAALVVAVMTGSRAAFAGGATLTLIPIVLGAFVVLRASRLRAKHFRRGLLLLAAVALLVAAVAATPYARDLRVSSVAEVLPRSDIWSAAVAGMRERPLTGFTSFEAAWSVHGTPGTSISHAHNLALEFGVRFGVFGLAIVGVGVATLVGSIAKTRSWRGLLVFVALAVTQAVDFTVLYFPVLFAATLALAHESGHGHMPKHRFVDVPVWSTRGPKRAPL